MNKLKRLIKTYKLRLVELEVYIDLNLVSKYAREERRITYRAKKKIIRALEGFAQETEKNMMQLQMDLVNESINYNRCRTRQVDSAKYEKNKEQIQKDLTRKSLQYAICRYRIKQIDLAKQADVAPTSLTKYLKGTKPMSLNMQQHLISSLNKLAQDIAKRMSLLQKELKKWSKIDDTDEDI